MGQDFFQNQVSYNQPQQYQGIMDLLKQFQGAGAPKVGVPGTPYSQAAMSGMAGDISQNLPAINEFLTRTLKTGGIDEGLQGQQLKAMGQQWPMAARDITARVTGSMPMGSSAATSALTQGLSEGELSNRQAMMQFLQSQQQQGLSNRMGAVSGMEGVPSYMAQPSSIEMAMIGAQQPFQLANLGAQQNYMNTLLSGMGGSYYTPEAMVQPSMWSQTIEPLLSALMGGLLKGPGLPTKHRGGVIQDPVMMAVERFARRR